MATNSAGFFDQVEAALTRLQPELKAVLIEGKIYIAGNFICYGKEGAFETYEIELLLQAGFPEVEPFVRETGNKIPRLADRHIYPSTGQCCLCVWQEWLWKTRNPDFEEFLVGPLHSYFVSQSLFELTGHWPFGERRHDREGLDQALEEMLDTIPNASICAALATLSQAKVKGHIRCPCGSGKRLRNCHVVEIHALKDQLPSTSWQEMRRQRKAYR